MIHPSILGGGSYSGAFPHFKSKKREREKRGREGRGERARRARQTDRQTDKELESFQSCWASLYGVLSPIHPYPHSHSLSERTSLNTTRLTYNSSIMFL